MKIPSNSSIVYRLPQNSQSISISKSTWIQRVYSVH